MSTQELIIKVFEGSKVFFIEDGYINATKAAKKYSKKPETWLKTEQTQHYIKAISKKLNIKQNRLAVVKRGSPETGGGTWIHPSLLKEFERWCASNKKDENNLPELYVVLFNTGVIKIGKGRNGFRRIKTHISQATCFGVKSLKFFIENNPKITEEELIQFCNQQGTLHHGNEYFKDLNYDSVVEFTKRNSRH